LPLDKGWNKSAGKTGTTMSKLMQTKFILIMGVSGCGKTTVGKELARQLGWDFYDGDDYHSPENIAKMANGIPLSDEDRAAWLTTLHGLISSCLKENHPGVLACSALKDRYRQQLLEGNDGVQVVYLKGSFDLFQARLSLRKGHYMKPGMLQSQFESLEEPREALVLDSAVPVDELVARILEEIQVS
jgi:gluconokinase